MVCLLPLMRLSYREVHMYCRRSALRLRCAIIVGAHVTLLLCFGVA